MLCENATQADLFAHILFGIGQGIVGEIAAQRLTLGASMNLVEKKTP